MADDLDQELLGLADGGDESDEESIDDFDRLEQEVGERAPSVEPQASVEKVEDAPQRLRGVAQKVKGRRKRKVRQESEEEDDAA
jgi:RNA polymerase-associated protein RTF1